MNPGDKVTWFHEQRGGYGFIAPVAGIVVCETAQRVRIAVFNLRTKQVEEKAVRRASLTVRTKTSQWDEAMTTHCIQPSEGKPMNSIKALSIRQPWAWLIVQGDKDVENREWSTTYRGRLLIHAGKQPDEMLFEQRSGLYSLQRALSTRGRWREGMPKRYEDCQYGGIVGAVTLVAVVRTSSSTWFRGTFGLVLADPIALSFVPLRGQVGLFDVPVSSLPPAYAQLWQPREPGEA